MSILDMFKLDGRNAIVTGAAQGLGKAMAQALGEAGANVAIVDINLDLAKDVAGEFSERLGRKFIAIKADVTVKEEVDRMVEDVISGLGCIDILVNNAGGHSPSACGLLEKETLAGWNDFISSNLTGTFLMLREYAKLMMPKGHGCIINIASIAGLVGRDRRIYRDDMTPNPIAYSAAKAGVIGLSRDVAAYLGPYGIRVNTISPGGFQRNQPKHFIQDYAELTMLRRMGQSGDLGGAVVFLASEAAKYITGHNLVLDGGFTEIK